MTYEYWCEKCHGEFTRDVSMASRNDQFCECGAQLIRRYIPSRLSILVPERFHTNKEDILPDDHYDRHLW